MRGALGVAKEYATALRATLRLRVDNIDPLPFAVAVAVVMVGAVGVYAVRGGESDGSEPAHAAYDSTPDGVGAGDGGDARSRASGDASTARDDDRSEVPGTTGATRVVAATAGTRGMPAPGTGAPAVAGTGEGEGTGSTDRVGGTRPTAPGSTSTTDGGPSTPSPDTTVPSTSTTVPPSEPPDDSPGRGPLGSVLDGVSGLLDAFF